MNYYRKISCGINRFASAMVKRKVDFIIAGAQKSGTTTLNAHLQKHPQIGMSSVKETHFFDTNRHFENGNPPYEIFHTFFIDVWLRKMLGESTPNYMYFKQIPPRLRDYNPDLKWIMILREPVSRAYSAWNMQRQAEQESRSFGECIRHELKHVPLPSDNGPRPGYVYRGFYSGQLEYIWKFFPREQTLVLKTDDLKDNHFETVNRICRFLGLKPFTKELRELGYHVRSYEEPISTEDKEFLSEVYRPEIKKLEKLLNWDCSKWLANKISCWLIAGNFFVPFLIPADIYQ